MVGRSYDDDKRLEIVDFWETHGYGKTFDKYGTSIASLHRWRERLVEKGESMRPCTIETDDYPKGVRGPNKEAETLSAKAESIEAQSKPPPEAKPLRANPATEAAAMVSHLERVNSLLVELVDELLHRPS